MATERVTLGDLRAVAKTADGLRIGHWVVGNPDDPLIEPLRAMADDIATWFKPDQRWKLMAVNTGLISRARMSESLDQNIADHEPDVKRVRAKTQDPDQFLPVFQFEAQAPPMRGGGFLRGPLRLNFPAVFADDLRDRALVNIESPRSADVHPEHIGPIYTLEKALQELSSPYFLVGTTVSVSSRQPVPSTVFELEERKRTGFVAEPATRLTVMVFARDLMDHTHLEINRLRRVQRQLDKKFPPLQPAQEQTTT